MMDGVLFNVCMFFKQKTAYEMRISYWNSDVCSSDLREDSFFGARFFFVAPGAAERGVELVFVQRLFQAFGFHDVGMDGRPVREGIDRKSVVSGKSVSVRVDLGGRRIINKIKHNYKSRHQM